MKLKAAIATLFLIPAAVTAQVADTSATPISLGEAVRLAQQNAPSAVQARGAISTSEAAVKQSYAAFLPSFSLSAGRNRQSGERFDTQGNLVPFTGQPTSYSTGLSSNLQIFDGGRRYFDLKRSKAEVDVAEAGEIASRFQIALQVKQQYYNILAARESQSAADAQIQQTEQQLRSASLRLRAGAATLSDSLRSVVLLGNARLARLTAQNSLQLANATLTRLVASPIPLTALASDTVDQRPTIPTIAELEPLIARSPAVEQADAQLTAANASVRAAKTSFLPTVNMGFNRGGSGLDPKFGIGDKRYAYSQSLNFSLNFPLFNNLNREVTVARAVVAEDVAEAAVRDARYLARQTLVQSLGQMTIAREQVDIQIQSVRAAEEDLRVQQRRYELGATTLLDLLTSQTQLDNARTGLIRARYDYRVAKAQLEALIGRDL
ncbi:MAG: TolC family protein [Gemmatimonadota bacterium]|nr:TolC family protein [Gemmatimonadota bacterium]